MSNNLNDFFCKTCLEDEDLCCVIDAKPLKVQKGKLESVLNRAH
jgi:hypothetical protein